MIIVLFILLVVSAAFAIVYWSESDDFCGKISFTLILILTIISIVVFCETPRAIDVYRGNTTLEITYKDSIAIDSVVVFKR